MQIIETETEVTVKTSQDDAPCDAQTLSVEQHRVYVWSSPSPFAVVVNQQRSFLQRD